MRLNGDCKYDYDVKGNRIKVTRGADGIMHDDYVYNSKNELTSITSFIRGIRQKQVSFTYDVFGRRLSKKTKNFIANESKPDSQTNFLWNGHILLAEDRVEIGDKSDFTTFSKYYIHRPYSFEVLAQVIREYRDDPEGEYLPQAEQGCFYYYHNDHIGTPQELLRMSKAISYGRQNI